MDMDIWMLLIYSWLQVKVSKDMKQFKINDMEKILYYMHCLENWISEDLRCCMFHFLKGKLN